MNVYNDLIKGLSILSEYGCPVDLDTDQIRVGDIDPYVIFPRHRKRLEQLGWSYEPNTRTTGHWIYDRTNVRRA